MGEYQMKRHGDLLLVQVNSVPPNAKSVEQTKGRNGYVLAYGEVSGHSHLLAPVGKTKLQLVQDAEENMYFTIEEGEAQLTHEEHNTLTFTPGTWKVIRQREYQPKDLPRRVAD